jgi:hypothetical protein
MKLLLVCVLFFSFKIVVAQDILDFPAPPQKSENLNNSRYQDQKKLKTPNKSMIVKVKGKKIRMGSIDILSPNNTTFHELGRVGVALLNGVGN